MRWILLALFGTGVLRAQIAPVVVSEYFNTSPEPVEEWTELLVIADTLDLRGYILTDNNQTQTQPQGGVRFRDVPLWRRLRAGTIIVINHRGSQVVDGDARDGYVEIGAQNTTYFEQIRLDSNPGLRWEDVALNVALQGDILQLLDPQGRHVHALGHRQTPGPFFDSLPPPKVHHNGSCPNPGSVRVVPGLSLAAYNAGAGTDSTAALSEWVTKGLPNQSPQHRDLNQLLWRRLRQPRWETPRMLRAELSPVGVHLAWSAAEDPFPQDSLQGYIVVRDTAEQRSIPEDGRTYSVGERIGGGLVVAQTFADVRQTVDTFPFPCGARYVYRVYAFRYRTDDRLGNAPGATTARGRSYNEESYAEAWVEKPLPPVPRVHASAREICEGDSVVLWVEEADTNAYRYQWFLNGVELAGATTPRLTVRVGGLYTVERRTALGCRVSSAGIEIRLHSLPRLWVTIEGDTLFCPGDTVVLRAMGAQRYRWYRDGIPIDSGAECRTGQPGRYWVTGWSEFGCTATSRVIELKHMRVRLRVEPAQLNFGVLGACEAVLERGIRLTNESDVPVLLLRPVVPSGFAVVGQSFPVELAVGQSLSLRLRFAPPRGGGYSGMVRFRLHPCSVEESLEVRGEKQPGVASLSLPEVNFGVEASCRAVLRDTLLWLSNGGGVPVVAEAAWLEAPFSVVEPAFPVEVAPADSVAIRVRYEPAVGSHVRELSIAIRSGTCRDTLRATLLAVVGVPQVVAWPSQLEFPPLLGCHMVAETTLVLRNAGLVPVWVSAASVAGVAVEGVPVELLPLESRTVRLRVQPPGAGVFTGAALLRVEPCDDTLRIPIRVVAEGVTAGFASDTLEFPRLVWCGRSDTAVLTLRFHTNAGRAELIESDMTGDTAAFSVGWRKGQSVVDGEQLAVRFHPPGVGSFWARIAYRMQVDTCHLVRVLTVRGTAAGVEYELTTDGTDFGTVAVGQRVQRSLRLRNPNPFPLVLQALEGVEPPFAVQTVLQLPDTLDAGQERRIVLVYAPLQAPRQDTLRLQLRWAAPCDTVLTVLFVGASESGAEPLRLQIELPAAVRAEAGENVTIPLAIATEQAAALEAVRFLRLRFRYDWRLYDVHRVEGALHGGEVRPGELLLEGAFPVVLPRELARIHGRALWHPQRQTRLELTLDSVESSVPVAVRLGSGMLIVDSSCLAWQRYVGTGTALRLWMEATECPQVAIRLGSDEEVEVLLVDLYGREVFRWWKSAVQHGQLLRLLLPCSEMAPGAYGVIVRQGVVRRTLAFIYAP